MWSLFLILILVHIAWSCLLLLEYQRIKVDDVIAIEKYFGMVTTEWESNMISGIYLS